MREPSIRYKLRGAVVLGCLVAAAGVGMLGRRMTDRGVLETQTVSDGHVRSTPVSNPDELDKDQLDQLHAATLKASESCLEIKKLCATILIPAGTLVSIFTDRRFNGAVLISGLLIILAFWLADSFGYYYQRKLRSMMVPIWERRAARCAGGYQYVPNDRKVGAIRAAFNVSMLYYLALTAVLAVGFLLYSLA